MPAKYHQHWPEQLHVVVEGGAGEDGWGWEGWAGCCPPQSRTEPRSHCEDWRVSETRIDTGCLTAAAGQHMVNQQSKDVSEAFSLS